MLPLQFILLLILAVIPGEIAEAARAGAGSAGPTGASTLPAAPDTAMALWSMASLFASQLLVGAIVMFRTRRAIRQLHEPGSSSTVVTARTDALYNRCRLLTAILLGAHLFGTPLAAAVFYWRDQTHIIRYIPLVAELFFLLPALLAWMVIWAGGYYVEAAIRERAMPYRLAQAMPVHEIPPLGSFLLMQARHNFFPLVFVFMASLLDKVAGLSPKVAVAGSVAGSIGMLIGVPMLLTKVWSTTPLLGPLRVRLDRVAELYRLRFRNILMWRTHNLMINAAILGWFPGARYFLMSDSLLESLSDRQLEAVFAHEVGHGVHWHIPWYLATLGGAMMLAMGASATVLYLSPYLNVHADAAGTVMVFALFALFGGLAIYHVAPRFEHQADWFASRHMARMLMESPEAVPETVPARDALPTELHGTLSTIPSAAETITVGQYLAGDYAHSKGDAAGAFLGGPGASGLVPYRGQSVMEEGAEIFNSALDSIVESTHRSRERRGMMHPSINDRVQLTRAMARDEEVEQRFVRSMFRTRVVIVLLVVAGIGALAGAAMLPDVPAGGAAATTGAPMTTSK